MTLEIKKLKQRAAIIRREIIKMSYRARHGHIGSALSTVDILTALYFKILSINPKRPKADNRDRFILSKGHAASALYVVLAQRGFFDSKLLENYLVDGSVFAAHPSFYGIPGIELSTGSLGHGLSVAVGMALAAKYDKKKCRVFVILSDGECDEGSTWEAAMSASQFRLDNLTVIVDYNELQAFGKTKEVMDLEPFVDKWKSFNFSVQEVNGHNMSQIINSLKKVPFKKGKPSVIIAHTVKGKGVSFMENKLEWHYNVMSEKQFTLAMEELQ